MAEIQQQDKGGGKGGKVRAKKHSTKIDMTPMVDLAFLLLTFFMLTTTFNRPCTMELLMPDKPKDQKEQPEVNQKKVLTLLLGKDDKIYWYRFPETGLPKVEVTNYSKDGVRKLLFTTSTDIDGRYPPKLNKDGKLVHEMLVLIKLADDSRYKNMVDILDEMNINNIQKYALVDITKVDLSLIKDSGL